jgi:hypothetical protein
MSLDRVINILVTITLIEMMVLIGLRVTFTELAQTEPPFGGFRRDRPG